MRRRSWAVVAAMTVAAIATSLLPVATAAQPPLNRDAAFFQHAGWLITQGAIPYVDIWDLKPPGVYLTTAVLALLAGGNMAVLHWLGIAVSLGSVGLMVALVAALTADYTGRDAAGVLAAGFVLAVPGVHWLAAHGFRPKYPMIAAGLLGAWLYHRDRATAAGIAVGVATAYYHLGAAFGVGIVATALRTGRHRDAARVVGAAAAVLGIVAAPIIAAGAGRALVVEVLLVPLTVAGNGMETHLIRLHSNLGIAAGLLALGCVGTLLAARRPAWTWLGVVSGLAVGQVLLLDFDAYPDAFLLASVAAIGLGIISTELPLARLQTVALGVATLLLGIQTAAAPHVHGEDAAIVAGVDTAFDAVYWQQSVPEHCHYKLSPTESAWLDRTGRQVSDPCGQWPSLHAILGGHHHD